MIQIIVEGIRYNIINQIILRIVLTKYLITNKNGY